MPTRPVESTHEAEPNYPIQKEGTPGVESPSGDRMQGSPGLPRRSSAESDGAEAGGMHAEPNPASAGPRESTPGDKAALPSTNEDDATSGDQDIDTAGTEHDELSPTKSM
jgi:hypothetical protein